METPKIKILLLGSPMILVDDKLTRVSRRRHRLLIYYLAAQSQPVTRGEICELFWPNVTETTARKNLREALSRIKSDLGSYNIFHTVDDRIMFNSSVVYSDIVEFEEIVLPLMNSTAMNSDSSLPDWMILDLKKAMDLCRTPWFLHGVDICGPQEFEKWKEETNHWYSYIHSRIVDRLVDHFISAGDLENALVWLKTGLESDRMNADMNYLMLTCLRDLGKFQRMIDEIDFLEGYYRKNGESLPEQIIELKSVAESSQDSPDYADIQEWAEPDGGGERFYGRKNELERLNRALHTKGVVLVKGEPGSGKTRLIREFYNQRPYPLRLFYLSAHPLAERVPFQALCEMLEEEIKEEELELLPIADREKLHSFYHDQLQGMKPSILPASAEGWLPLLQDVFNIFVKIMENAAKKRTVLFVVDDAQWIDQASLSVINYLIKRNYFRRYGLLVIIKRLDDNNKPLYLSNLRLTKHRKMKVITLAGFTHNETSEFLQTTLGNPIDSELTDWLFQKTGGNPFLLTEYLRVLHIHFYKTTANFEQAAIPIPEAIKGMVNEKLEFLSPEGLIVVQAAAVLGSRFGPDELGKTAGLEIEKTLNALEELVKDGIIKGDPEAHAAGGYTFSHEIEREVIIAKLSPARSQYLHHRAANSILECRGRQPELSSVLADHFEKAAEPVEAVSFWLGAGRYYRSIYDQGATNSAYERAANLITKNPFLFSGELIHQVFNEWGNYAYDLSDHQYCERISNNCLEIGKLRTDPLLIGTGLSGLGRAAGMKFEIEKAQEYFQRAIFYLQRADDAMEMCDIYSRIGIVCFINDEFLKAREAFEKGLRIAEKTNFDQKILEGAINNLSQLCILLVYTGETRKAQEYALEMVNYSRGVGRRSAVVQAYSILVMTHYFSGEFNEAIKVGLEILQAADRLKLRFWQSFIDIALGQSYLMVGNLDAAWLHMSRALKREEGYPGDRLYDQSRMGMGLLYQMTGENTKALATFQGLVESKAHSISVYESCYFMGVNLEILGKSKEAVKYIDRLISSASETGLRTIELSARMTRAIIFRRHMTPEKFNDEVEPLSREVENAGYFSGKFLSGWCSAITAEKSGDIPSAIQCYQELAAYCQKIGSPVLEFIPLQSIISLAMPSSREAALAMELLQQRLNDLLRNATTPPVKGFVKRLRLKNRKNWQFFVNGTVV